MLTRCQNTLTINMLTQCQASENIGGIKVMRKVTQEEIALKREEIINACEQLYQTLSFREITLKEISKITSFSRPTIYNYFETKEEIFLGLFQRENRSTARMRRKSAAGWMKSFDQGADKYR